MKVAKDGITHLVVNPCKLFFVYKHFYNLTQRQTTRQLATKTTTVINLQATKVMVGSTDVGKLASDTSSLVQTLKAQLATANSNIASLEQTVSKLQSDYVALNNRINAVDTLAVCFCFLDNCFCVEQIRMSKQSRCLTTLFKTFIAWKSTFRTYSMIEILIILLYLFKFNFDLRPLNLVF
jgi:hypothetical protein